MKSKHERPEVYRIIFRAGRRVTKDERYYNVFHSSEALEDIYHTFQSGRIHSTQITIYRIQEHNRFTDKWENRMDAALEHLDIEESIRVQSGRIIITRKS